MELHRPKVSIDSNLQGAILTSNIKPIKASIEYDENFIPYLKYTGEVMTSMGLCEIFIPHISLTFTEMEISSSKGVYEFSNCFLPKSYNNQLFVNNSEENIYFELKLKKVNMTVEEIEQKLGYKINIINSKDKKE